jgi:RNA dependent RNA polymerase
MHPPESSLYRKYPMVNCLVFSCKGKLHLIDLPWFNPPNPGGRPPASMLGGGDLDGVSEA